MNNSKSMKSIFYMMAAMLVIAFPALLLRDYSLTYEFGSAPFYLYVGERLLELVVPAAILYIIGRKIK